jgi:two-component system LytT family response regulator
MLIDDEPNNLELLYALITKHFPQLQIVESSGNPVTAIKQMDELEPQLVFLDVEMPGMTGFEVLKKLEPVNFEVIFVTAYTHYAVQAFEANAIGYLTKPVAVDKFIEVTNRAIQKIQQQQQNKNLFSLLENHMQQNQQQQKIPLPSQTGMQFVPQQEIIFLESSGNYTKFYLLNKKEILISRQLGEYEKLLPVSDFLRIHDKYLVNVQQITEYIKGSGGQVVMLNGYTLPVAVRRKDELLSRFDKWLKRG